MGHGSERSAMTGSGAGGGALRGPGRRLSLAGLAVAGTIAGSAMAETSAGEDAVVAAHAVVFAYHGFSDDDAAPGLAGSDLDLHLAELAAGPYAVRPLGAVIEAIKRGDALADRTVALTVDDPSHAVLSTAWPRLQQAGMPFTL